MAIYTDDKYRVKRNAEYQDDMLLLINNDIFPSYASVLMISAIIGYLNNQYVPIVKQAQDGVQTSFFSEHDKDFIDFIAFAHTKKQKILGQNGALEDGSTKYNIFESYANGGFPILLQKLKIDGDDIFDAKKTLLNYYHLLLTEDIDFESDPSDILI